MPNKGNIISGFIFLTCLGFFQVVFLHRLGWSWDIALVDSGISQLLLALICLSVVSIFSYYQPRQSFRLNRLAIGIGFALLYTFILEYLLTELFDFGPDYQTFLSHSLPLRFLYSFLIIAFTVLSIWLWRYFTDEKKALSRKEELEKLRNEAELVRLQQQIQPHFLFNSLNSINALIGVNPGLARKMTQQLSDFLRGTIKKEKEFQTLADELTHLQLYLDIEKLRFGNRLEINFDVDPESLSISIPAMLLQPIVENAIKFGLYGTIDQVDIKIKAQIIGTYLELKVSNPFDSEATSHEKGTGFGLSSIRRRLQLIYHRNDLAKIENIDNQFITRLTIPIQDEKSNPD